MNMFILLKKETVEAFRTYRFLIILTIFVLFGLASSVTAKLMPEIIQAVGGGSGIEIHVAEPSVYDSWLQFFSNHSQMTLIIFLLMFGHSLAKEVTGGTLVLLVTKGINRNTAMAAKVLYQSLLWFGGLCVSFVITYFYNLWLFVGETQNLATLSIYLFQLWLFGVLFIAAVNLGQVLLPKSLGGLLVGFICLVVLFVINISSDLAKINPMRLIEVSTEGLKNSVAFNDIQLPILASVGLVVVFLLTAAYRFKRVAIY